jgi:hypothetical protein
MLVALHIDPNDWSRLLGLWLAPDGAAGVPDSYHPDPDDGLEVGRGRMEVKGDTVPWSAFFWRLKSSSPYSAYWSVHEVPDGPPSELFERFAVEVAESAHHLAASSASQPFTAHSVTGPLTIFVPGVSVSHQDLAKAAGGPTSSFDTQRKLSTLCSFFADEPPPRTRRRPRSTRRACRICEPAPSINHHRRRSPGNGPAGGDVGRGGSSQLTVSRSNKERALHVLRPPAIDPNRDHLHGRGRRPRAARALGARRDLSDRPTVEGRSTRPLGHTLPSRAMIASPIRSGYSIDGQWAPSGYL